MLSPTTRTMHITYFKVLCIDKENKSVVYKDLRLYKFETDIVKLLKYVKKMELVKEPLIPKRVVAVKCANEVRTMTAQKFYKLSTLKRSIEK